MKRTFNRRRFLQGTTTAALATGIGYPIKSARAAAEFRLRWR
jgi:hypothetical protein